MAADLDLPSDKFSLIEQELPIFRLKLEIVRDFVFGSSLSELLFLLLIFLDDLCIVVIVVQYITFLRHNLAINYSNLLWDDLSELGVVDRVLASALDFESEVQNEGEFNEAAHVDGHHAHEDAVDDSHDVAEGAAAVEEAQLLEKQRDQVDGHQSHVGDDVVEGG